MIADIVINSGAYTEPFETRAIYTDFPSRMSLKWEQLHDGDEKSSYYLLELDKVSGVVTVRRSGEYKSLLVFDTSCSTVGQIVTPYGEIPVAINTEYIKVPTVLFPGVEISYFMGEEKNVFSVVIKG